MTFVPSSIRPRHLPPRNPSVDTENATQVFRIPSIDIHRILLRLFLPLARFSTEKRQLCLLTTLKSSFYPTHPFSVLLSDLVRQVFVNENLIIKVYL